MPNKLSYDPTPNSRKRLKTTLLEVIKFNSTADGMLLLSQVNNKFEQLEKCLEEVRKEHGQQILKSKRKLNANDRLSIGREFFLCGEVSQHINLTLKEINQAESFYKYVREIYFQGADKLNVNFSHFNNETSAFSILPNIVIDSISALKKQAESRQKTFEKNIGVISTKLNNTIKSVTKHPVDGLQKELLLEKLNLLKQKTQELQSQDINDKQTQYELNQLHKQIKKLNETSLLDLISEAIKTIEYIFQIIFNQFSKNPSNIKWSWLQMPEQSQQFLSNKTASLQELVDEKAVSKFAI